MIETTEMNDASQRESSISGLKAIPFAGAFALEAAFRADSNEQKVNLGIGAYRDEQGKPWMLPSVAKAKQTLGLDICTHEYLPLWGSVAFLDTAKSLLFGDDQIKQIHQATKSIQTVSGSGANSLIARFLGEQLRPTNVWLPDPTWDNHFRIWRLNAPNVTQRQYPYLNKARRCFDHDGMIQTLRQHAEPNDVILLHACAHNPTGLDPSQDQWREIADLCEEKKMFVVFDAAYQGFASGDMDIDAWAMRYFVSKPSIEMAVCQSFSKNMGLYGERVGALHIVVSRLAPSPALVSSAALDHLIEYQRGDISMPPRFGATIAERVMTSPETRAMWISDLAAMSGRMKTMRNALYDELVRLGTPGDWSHIIEQTGMFSYTGLTEVQVAILQEDYHVYMLPTGRASLSGLTTKNVDYAARAIHAVVMLHA